MDAKLAKIYYSPQGYWKGLSAIKKLANAAKVPSSGLSKRIWGRSIFPQHPTFPVQNSMYLHLIRYIRWIFFFLPHDKLPRRWKVYKYALTVVDVASCYKEAEPLTSKYSPEVAKAFQAIYRCSPLTWPQMLKVDPGHEFMGTVTKEMENHKTYIRRGRTEIHRDQAIIDRFNRTLAERYFGH